MESRRKRSRSQRLKWGCYILLLVVCTVLQTMPGLFQFGAAKPLWLLPLCLAVSAAEGEFAGAIFGAVCGLMWDYTAGRTVGMLALELMILCFGVSVVVQLYLKDTPSNFVLLAVVCYYGISVALETVGVMLISLFDSIGAFIVFDMSMNQFLLLAVLLGAALSAVWLALTRVLLNRHLNLE